jgi:hypothetical protein
MNDQKKAAAVSAVLHYIRTEQEAAAAMAARQSGAPQVPLSVPAPAMAFKPWAMNGRQVQMQMGNLMQLRSFRKLR